MKAEFASDAPNPFLPEGRRKSYADLAPEVYQLYVVLHELYGHPTGKMLFHDSKVASATHLPVNPLTSAPVTTWYEPSQTFTGIFAGIATTVDECRCELVAAFLMDDDTLLSALGYGLPERPVPADILCVLYEQIGVDGLVALDNYHPDDQTWGSAHAQAHWAMLVWLLRHGNGVLSIECDEASSQLFVRVNGSKTSTCGTPALSRMLLHLHMYRCTADVAGCRSFYSDLSTVTSKEDLVWLNIVKTNVPPKKRFVQPNIVEENGELVLRTYAATNNGVIQSWYDRNL